MNKDVKEKILEQLSQLDEQTLVVAYSYAKYLVDYGCNVTQKWSTVIEQTANLEKAYQKGYYEGRESLLSELRGESDERA